LNIILNSYAATYRMAGSWEIYTLTSPCVEYIACQPEREKQWGKTGLVPAVLAMAHTTSHFVNICLMLNLNSARRGLELAIKAGFRVSIFFRWLGHENSNIKKSKLGL
jgi:hypothetical protein